MHGKSVGWTKPSVDGTGIAADSKTSVSIFSSAASSFLFRMLDMSGRMEPDFSALRFPFRSYISFVLMDVPPLYCDLRQKKLMKYHKIEIIGTPIKIGNCYHANGSELADLAVRIQWLPLGSVYLRL